MSRVGVGRAEVAGVDVHAEGLALHRLDERQHLLRRLGDAAVVLEGQQDAVLLGRLAALIEGGDHAASAPRRACRPSPACPAKMRMVVAPTFAARAVQSLTF